MRFCDYHHPPRDSYLSIVGAVEASAFLSIDIFIVTSRSIGDDR